MPKLCRGERARMLRPSSSCRILSSSRRRVRRRRIRLASAVQVQPRSAMRSIHSLESGIDPILSPRPPQMTSFFWRGGAHGLPGQLSSSQARVSARKSSSAAICRVPSGGILPESPQTAFPVPGQREALDSNESEVPLATWQSSFSETETYGSQSGAHKNNNSFMTRERQ